MKPADYYLNGGGDILREEFRQDIRRYARDANIPVHVALNHFFASGSLTNRQMGSFALYTTVNAELMGITVLVHALSITQKEAPGENVLVKYLDISPTDPFHQTYSWQIDAMLGWPSGTIMPQSRQLLFKL